MDEADEEADQSTDEAPITGIKVMGTLDYMAPEQASNTRSGRRSRRYLRLGLHASLPLDRAQALRRRFRHAEDPGTSGRSRSRRCEQPGRTCPSGSTGFSAA